MKRLYKIYGYSREPVFGERGVLLYITAVETEAKAADICRRLELTGDYSRCFWVYI